MIPSGPVLREPAKDELLQSISVLAGVIRLAGPRPPIRYNASNSTHWHNEGVEGLPGMTGLWQASGNNRLSFCRNGLAADLPLSKAVATSRVEDHALEAAG
jgi:lipopolysaccharide/colanic/teichoic acid biosynthesis glycosyltransferase